MARSRLAPIALAIAIAVPLSADAQSLDLSSSLDAACVGTCQFVDFTLNLGGGTGFATDLFRLYIPSEAYGTDWVYADHGGGKQNVAVSGYDEHGNPVTDTWQGTIYSGVFEGILSNGGTFVWSPITFTIEFATFQASLGGLDGWTYSGQALDEQLNVYSYGGPVSVPEPMSLLLLGSGLLGVFGVARRRREEGAV
jgi:hypothetical protein